MRNRHEEYARTRPKPEGIYEDEGVLAAIGIAEIIIGMRDGDTVGTPEEVYEAAYGGSHSVGLVDKARRLMWREQRKALLLAYAELISNQTIWGCLQMVRVFLFIPELSKHRHIIIDKTHIVNMAAPESNVYRIVKRKEKADGWEPKRDSSPP